MITFVSTIPVLLGNLLPGCMFTDAEQSYFAVKSEYRTGGLPECTLLDSGEAFHGPKEVKDINTLMVYPVIMKRVTA